MRKIVIIVLFCTIIFSGIVSAGFFDWITGNVVADNECNLFGENFDDGKIEGWAFSNEKGVPIELGDNQAWDIFESDYLHGENHVWAKVGNDNWRNYVFESTVQIVQGTTHVVFRKGTEGRYFFGINENEIYLNKEAPHGTFHELVQQSADIKLGAWYDLTIIVNEENIDILIGQDGVIYNLTYYDVYNDEDGAIFTGAIAFEPLEDAIVNIDNIQVTNAKDGCGVSDYLSCNGNEKCEEWENENNCPGDCGDNGDDTDECEDGSCEESPCNLIPESGRCKAIKERYYFDSNSQSCKEFNWGGCGGVVPFEGLKECESSCETPTNEICNDNDICEEGENNQNCPTDCWCGNGACEDEESCEKDCGVQLPLQIWEKTNGPGGGKIIDIAFDKINSNLFYTAVYPMSGGLLDGGIYKTTNDGATWQRKISGINDKETWSISIDPNNNNVLWVGANSGEIYKTENAGESWILKKEASGTIENPTSDTIYSVEINPFNSNEILAGSRHGNLFKSDDGGNSWETIHNENGLTLSGVISDITYDETNENVVYLTSGFFDVWDFVGNGIYKSIDGGETWNRLENGLEEKTQFGDLVIDPSDSNVIYATNGMETNGDINGEDLGYLYRSEDAGKSWGKIDIGSQFNQRFTLNSVVIHPENSDRIYVLGQDQRILISENRGDSWELITDSGLIGIGTFVEYHPLNYNIMYATTYAAGIFKSIDGGRTWEDLNGKEISFAYVEGMLADSKNAGRLYTQSFENGFHYTDDYGESWQRGHFSGNYYMWGSMLEKTESSNNIYALNRNTGWLKRLHSLDGVWELLAIPIIGGNEPALNIIKGSDITPDLFFLGTWENGVLKSEDGGDNWVKSGDSLNNLNVKAIAIDPQNDNTIYAGSINEKGRIWLSDNQGENWNLLNDEMTFTTIHAMDVDTNNKNTIYAAPWGAGLFKSVDGGSSWNEIVGGGESEKVFSLAAIKVHPKDSNILFAVDRADSLLIKSEDGGKTWFSPWNPGEEKYFRLNTFVFDPKNPEVYYISAWKIERGGIQGDLFRHNENGGFEKITNELPRAVLDVEIDPSNSNNIYASTHLYGLFRSSNGGDSWNELSFPRAGIFDLSFNNNKLYATTNCGELPIDMLGRMAQHDGECGIYVSSDEGKTWNNLLPNNMRDTAVKQAAFNDGDIYIATNNDAYFSKDGKLWEALNVPFKETATINIQEDKLFVGTHGGGVYYQQIGATNWDNNGPYTTLLNMQIEVDPSDSNIIYASSFPGGVFKSVDAGITWNEKNFALPSFKVNIPDKQAYYSFLINPHNTNNLFLGLFGKGVYMSMDGADTWMPINSGLDNKQVYNIQLDASGKYLYAGTNGGSVYRANLSKLDLSEDDKIVSTDCDGCLDGDKCISYGIRKVGRYCDLSGEFIHQKEKSQNCENNFECSSNICIDETCVSGGLWKMFLRWMRK